MFHEQLHVQEEEPLSLSAQELLKARKVISHVCSCLEKVHRTSVPFLEGLVCSFSRSFLEPG